MATLVQYTIDYFCDHAADSSMLSICHCKLTELHAQCHAVFGIRSYPASPAVLEQATILLRKLLTEHFKKLDGCDATVKQKPKHPLLDKCTLAVHYLGTQRTKIGFHNRSAQDPTSFDTTGDLGPAVPQACWEEVGKLLRERMKKQQMDMAAIILGPPGAFRTAFTVLKAAIADPENGDFGVASAAALALLHSYAQMVVTAQSESASNTKVGTVRLIAYSTDPYPVPHPEGDPFDPVYEHIPDLSWIQLFNQLNNLGFYEAVFNCEAALAARAGDMEQAVQSAPNPTEELAAWSVWFRKFAAVTRLKEFLNHLQFLALLQDSRCARTTERVMKDNLKKTGNWTVVSVDGSQPGKFAHALNLTRYTFAL